MLRYEGRYESAWRRVHLLASPTGQRHCAAPAGSSVLQSVTCLQVAVQNGGYGGRTTICTGIKKLKQWIRSVRPNRKKNQVVLHDNARPHTGLCTRKAIATIEWTVLPRHPYSLDLAPFCFHPFVPWRTHSEESVLQTTTNWNTAFIKNSDSLAKGFTQLA